MLLFYDKNDPIYVIGESYAALHILDLISTESNVSAKVIAPDQVDSLPDGSQCVMGFKVIDYRLAMLSKTAGKNFRWPTYIHPSAIIANHTKIGKGIIILDQVHLGFESVIGDWCYLDTNVTITDAVKLGKNCVFAAGTVVGGSTTIGDNVVAGLNSTICNKIQICTDARFAMCSVVSHNINSPGSYYGTRRIKQIKI